MATGYLPPLARIEEASEWLHAQTGEQWTLARILEAGAMPWFWLDYKSGYPAIFSGRTEGYLAPLVYQGDVTRLMVDGREVLITMTRTHDGTLLKIEPGIRAPVSELRFKRETIEALTQGAQVQDCTLPRAKVPLASAYLPDDRPAYTVPDALELTASALHPFDPDDTRDVPAMKHEIARAEHEKALRQAVEAGAVEVLNPLTGTRYESPTGAALFRTMIPRDELRKFARERLRIELLQRTERGRDIACVSERENGPAVTVHRLSGRDDMLKLSIERAIQEAGGNSPSGVFARLREMALSGESPFTGEVTAKGLSYTDARNVIHQFTLNALRKRMKPEARGRKKAER